MLRLLGLLNIVRVIAFPLGQCHQLKTLWFENVRRERS